jgi:hypothetical protein
MNYAGGNQESVKASKRVNPWADTAEVNRWPKIDKSDSLNVTQLIANHLLKDNRDPIVSIHKLAGLITSTCIEVFDPLHARKDFRFFDFFEHSISIAVSLLPSLPATWDDDRYTGTHVGFVERPGCSPSSQLQICG